MFMGNSGILSWTHVGFVGIGAYAAGHPLDRADGQEHGRAEHVSVRSSSCNMPVLPAILVGGLVAAVFAAIIGYPLMRLSDFAGVITLFATLIVIHVVMTQWDNVTNGPRTFFGVPEYTTLTVGAHRRRSLVVIARVLVPGVRARSAAARVARRPLRRHGRRHQHGARRATSRSCSARSWRASPAACGRTTSPSFSPKSFYIGRDVHAAQRCSSSAGRGASLAPCAGHHRS